MTTWKDNVWKIIHVFGCTYEPSRELVKEGFKCFMECLKDILPTDDEKVILAEFLTEHPLTDYILSDKNEIFKWTYKLHSYNNIIKSRRGKFTNNISYEKACEMYDPKVLRKQDWANPTWYLLHYITANVCEPLSNEQKETIKALIVSLRYLIPCSECRPHFHYYIQTHEIDSYLRCERFTHDIVEDGKILVHKGTKKTPFIWTWQFHNSVNKRLGTEIFTLEKALSLYVVKKEVYTMIEDY